MKSKCLFCEYTSIYNEGLCSTCKFYRYTKIRQNNNLIINKTNNYNFKLDNSNIDNSNIDNSNIDNFKIDNLKVDKNTNVKYNRAKLNKNYVVSRIIK